ncbi:hypothetical protein [Paraglaciecola sp.]|uniref:hypothetical protein n=1 Tax=Paraglaciecola sp. TaxID=1920173 RepID=UPI0030F39FEA
MHRCHLKPWFTIIFAVFSANLGFTVIAQEWQDNLYINGFYTLGVTQTNADIDMVTAAVEKHTFGKGKPNLNHSLVGGQLQYQFSENFSVYVQGAAFIDRNEKLGHSIDWAYLNYDFDNDLSLRVGQFQTPFLQGTEMRKIGLSRLWARPLTPGNGASGFNEYKGAELVKKYSSGDHFWDFQLGLGRAEHQREEVYNKRMELATVRYQHSDSWIRMGLVHAYHRTERENAEPVEGYVLMGSVEAETRASNFVINIGLSAGDSDVAPKDSFQYLSLGYAFEQFTPYIYASRKRQRFEQTENATTPPPGRPSPPQGPPGSGSSQFVDEVNDHSIAMGVRWSISETLSLKTQLEKNRYQDRLRGGRGLVNTGGSALSIVLEGVY